jgi:hypothetical protein
VVEADPESPPALSYSPEHIMNRILSLQGMSVSYTAAAENSGLSTSCADHSCISYSCSGPAKPTGTIEPATVGG